MTDEIVTLFGKPLALCSREELERGIQSLGRLIRTMQDTQRRQLDMAARRVCETAS